SSNSSSATRPTSCSISAVRASSLELSTFNAVSGAKPRSTLSDRKASRTELVSTPPKSMSNAEGGLAPPDCVSNADESIAATLRRYRIRSEEHTSELQSRFDLVCRLLLEKKKYENNNTNTA